MSKTIYARDISLEPEVPVRWLGPREFEAPPGTYFRLKADIRQLNGEWITHYKYVDLQVARRLVRMESIYECVRVLMEESYELIVVLRQENQNERPRSLWPEPDRTRCSA